MRGGAADGAEEGDWCYGYWASEDAALGYVIVDFFANFERESKEWTVVIVVRALVGGLGLLCANMGDGRHDVRVAPIASLAVSQRQLKLDKRL